MVQRVSGFQLEPRLFGVFDEQPVAGEPADDALDETIEQVLEGLRVRWRDAMESGAVLFHGVDAVQDQHVQMDVQIECAAETLDQRDDSGSGARGGHEPRSAGKVGLDGADDDGKTTAERIRPTGE